MFVKKPRRDSPCIYSWSRVPQLLGLDGELTAEIPGPDVRIDVFDSGSEEGSGGGAVRLVLGDVKGHADLDVLASKLLRGDIHSPATGHHNADHRVNYMNTFKDVNGAILIGHRDSEDVDRIDKPVDDVVMALNTDDELTTRGGKGIIFDEVRLGSRGWGLLRGRGVEALLD
ncbi:hypothetical protein SAY86_001804 [Trapa natans]|uniref:Uncharacterized protein n=1 Tax=Trapa natans TaxID=22666 RepID=A0AAN7LGT4_TRANT|nr:hypothetical protein SAY86_001804 [Trapa natans]